MTPLPIRVVALATGLVTSLGILAAAVSQTLQPISPWAAVLINPFSDRARVEAIVGGLEEKTPDLDVLQRLAETGSSISPSDGRYLSLLGLVDARSGDAKAAQQHFIDALAIMPTEIQALLNRFADAISKNDVGMAVRRLSVISRRWPGQWTLVEPYLPSLLSTPEGLTSAAEIIGDNPKSRDRMLASLVAEPRTTTLAASLLNVWKEGGKVPIDELLTQTRQVSNALVQAEQYDQAYFLFRQTMDAEMEKVTGYVHNGQFLMKPTGSYFDWRVSPQSGARLTFSADGLNIRFLNTPVRFAALQQILRLPPGSYSLNARYSSREMVAPKPLQFIVRCISGALLGQMPLEAGTRPQAVAAVEFSVPADCKALRLQMTNDFQALSWSNRYNGNITLHEVNIQRLDKAAAK
jgi:hypothetical protein